MNGFTLPSAGAPRAHVLSRSQPEQVRQSAHRALRRGTQSRCTARSAGICESAIRAAAASVRGTAGAAFAYVSLSAGAAHAQATESIGQIADAGNLPLAVGGIAAIVALAATLVATDPEKRRTMQTATAGGDEMDSVRNYFNGTGFERWNKIYGETDEVNKVQLDIRTGHAQTVEKVLAWLDQEGSVAGRTVCDCGCGTGSLAIPLALRGAAVTASDISVAMAGEASRRYQLALEASSAAPPATPPKFEALDLESASGRYNTVTCLDVMIHYPQTKADGMIKHLASLADERLIISFAPYTPYYAVLKRIGELFPGPSKATRAYLHAEADVEKALNEAGFTVVKREMTATSFYFSRLLEAVRK